MLRVSQKRMPVRDSADHWWLMGLRFNGSSLLGPTHAHPVSGERF